MLVGGIVAVPLVVYLFAREVPDTPSRRRKRQLAPFVLVGLAGLALLIANRWPEEFATAVERLQLRPDHDASRPTVDDPARPPAVEWLPLAVVTSLTAMAAAGFAAWHLTRRRGPLRRRVAVSAALGDALDESLDDLLADPDVRRAIIRAYARMETALARCGVERRRAEAPLEYLARVLIELDVRAAPVRRLTGLFERAKFSDHAMNDSLKHEAVAALESAREDLRTGE